MFRTIRLLRMNEAVVLGGLRHINTLPIFLLSEQFSMVSMLSRMWIRHSSDTLKESPISHPSSLPDTVAKLSRSLEARDMGYAIGGAMALAAHGYVRATKDCDLNIYPKTMQPLLESLSIFKVQLPKDMNNLRLGPNEDIAQGAQLAKHIAIEWEEYHWFALWLDGVEFDFHLPKSQLQKASLNDVETFPLQLTDSTFVKVCVHSYLNLCKFKFEYFRGKDQLDLSELWKSRQSFDQPLHLDMLGKFVEDGFSGRERIERVNFINTQKESLRTGTDSSPTSRDPKPRART
jgi:hypothetical protein